MNGVNAKQCLEPIEDSSLNDFVVTGKSSQQTHAARQYRCDRCRGAAMILRMSSEKQVNQKTRHIYTANIRCDADVIFTLSLPIPFYTLPSILV